MDSPRSSSYCAECGFAQSSHTILWLDGFSNDLTRLLPFTSVPFYGFLMKITDGIISIIGRIGLFIGKLFGFITTTDDIETAVSDRSRLLWLEAKKRNIPMLQLLAFGNPTDTFVIGKNIYFFRSLPLPPRPDALEMDDKVSFKRVMTRAGLPVPRSRAVSSMRAAQKAFDEMQVVCLKPRSGSNGRHTYPYVHTPEQLRETFKKVRQISPTASLEEHLEGNLCRATCVDGSMIGFLESAYPFVHGDGISTIEELVEKANAAKLPNVDDIVLDHSVVGYINRRGYDTASVLPENTSLQLTYRGGTGAGGSNREHGRNIHESFIPFIEKAAVLTRLPIVGFDLIIPDPQAPADSQVWGFVEANSLPWIDLHAHPYYGEPIDLSAAVWDLWEKQNPALGIRQPLTTLR